MKRLLAALGLVLMTAPLWAQVTATATWQNPTQTSSGSTFPASQIRETRISFCTTSGCTTPSFVEVAPGAVTTHTTLPVFTAGQWFGRAQTIDTAGRVSPFSNESNFTVGVCQANPAGCIPRPPTNLTIVVAP
jgi:hypothetical protein